MAKTIKVLDINSTKRLAKLRADKKLYVTIHGDKSNPNYPTSIANYDRLIAEADKGAHPDLVRLIEEVHAVNGRAVSHTYSPDDVSALAAKAEQWLEHDGVKVANRPGTLMTATSGAPTTKAYARAARTCIVNTVVLKRTTNGWVLVSFKKTERWAGPGADEDFDLTISEAAKQDILAKALKGYRVAAQTIPPSVAVVA